MSLLAVKEAKMSDGMKKEDLYPLQESVLTLLQSIDYEPMAIAKLCGGTALSRCWINHRISYDLDFFLPGGFDARGMAEAMKKSGINYQTKELVDDPKKANQLHGYVSHNGKLLKVSFMEDSYFGVYPAVVKPFGSASVRTEEVPGLYHRKLRTVAGHGAEGDSFEGGRQKARDVFDLYVLSKEYKPLTEFIESLPYAFPSQAFNNGLASMPWYDLIDELSEIVCDEKWNQAKDVGFLQDALFKQIGAVLAEHEADSSEPIERLSEDSEPAKKTDRIKGISL